MNTASVETLDAIITENLKSAAECERLGMKEDAAYYRGHASELTVELLSRKPSMREILHSRGEHPATVPDHEFRATVNWYCRCGK